MTKMRSRSTGRRDAAFEFSGADNDTIAATGRVAGLWGAVSFGIGVFAGLFGVFLLFTAKNGVPAGAPFILLALGPLASGKAYVEAGRSLREVVRTEGSDIVLMTDAVRKLGTAARMEIAGIVAMVLVAVAFGVAGHVHGS
jgi:hypothetical protein